MNWVLTSGIFSGLRNLEDQFNWDMSVGENACCAEIFYKHLNKGFPKSIEDVHAMFGEAHAHTWGEDHECDETSNEEIQALLFAVSDYFIDQELKTRNRSDYMDTVKRLLI